MTNEELLTYIDHTLLSPTASEGEIFHLCGEAMKFHTASVCIPPCYVRSVRTTYPGLNICTVIGFPLGYSTKTAKLSEAENALLDGANELDMVVNISDVKNGKFADIVDEISAIKWLCGEKILKVIVETCYLTEEEKIQLCKCVTEAGADYIKTSTGFGTSGAVLSDIELFRKNIGENVKIKAAGGIKTKEQIEAFIEAGCSRIGSSSGVALLAGEKR